MGIIKSLTLQMIPWWCFHQVMDSTTSSAAVGKPAALSTRLIRPDGKVDVYHRPVTASEVMRDHPMHLVCRSDAFTIGQRIPALAEGEQLEPGHAYFLLPLHFFQSVLSFVTLAASFARAAGTAPALLRRPPFEVLRAPSGKLQIRVCDEFIRRIQEDGGGGGRVCTTAALVRDYRLLVVGWKERQWKPKLETIRESADRKGKLGGGAGAVERRRKKGQQDQGDDDDDRKVQQQQQKKKKKKKKKQMQKAASTIAKHLNSPPSSHKSKAKKVMACRP